MRDDIGRLIDILEAIEAIQKYTSKGRKVVEHDELIQTWVIHHLQIIGEAARGLSGSLRKKHKNIPWTEIIGMRNILVHHYFGVDFDEVWSTVEVDLPSLQKRVISILENFKRSPS